MIVRPKLYKVYEFNLKRFVNMTPDEYWRQENAAKIRLYKDFVYHQSNAELTFFILQLMNADVPEYNVPIWI
jgi:hypothetical protein